MKKVFAILPVLALLAMSSVAYADVERVVGSWSLLGEHGIVFSCGAGTYPHTAVISAEDPETGVFSGIGTYDPNSSYTWDINGVVDGNDVTFTIIYTGANSGYTLHGDGVISPDGSVTGDVDNNCQTFDMAAGTATMAEYKNHGQYVRSQADKKAAAHSRIGMPTNSKGHLHE